MNDFLKSMGVALIPMVITALIGYGVFSAKLDNIETQQAADAAVNIEFAKVRDDVEDLEKRADRMVNTISNLSVRMSDTELSSVRTVTILEQLTIAVGDLTKASAEQTRATAELTKQVIRLEERSNGIRSN